MENYSDLSKKSSMIIKSTCLGSSIPSKLTKDILPNKAQKLSKEQIFHALKKQKNCNNMAQAVVEYCQNRIVDDGTFVTMLKNINKCHYENITEERAIQNLCGYPLCKEDLKEVPKKDYHIATNSNKVYDITDRKNFCSNYCYKASNYLKAQLLTSPLWLRDVEDIPHFILFKSK